MSRSVLCRFMQGRTSFFTGHSPEVTSEKENRAKYTVDLTMGAVNKVYTNLHEIFRQQ